MARRWDSGFKTQHTINPENTSPQKYGVTDEEKAKWNSKQDALQYDEVPTEGSTKVMMSMHLKRVFENFKQEITGSYKRYFNTYSEELTAASAAINAAAQQAQDMTAQVINASEQAVSAANDAASSSSAAAYQAELATDRVEIMQEYLQDANYAANRAHSEAERAVLMADRTAALAEEAERIAEQKAAETANTTVKPLVTVAQSAAAVASTYKQDAAEQAAYAKRQADQAKMYAENAAAIADVQIATDTRAGLIKGGDNHIAEDGTLQLTKVTTDSTLTNSHSGSIKVLGIYGNTEQDGTSGAQLFDKTKRTDGYVMNYAGGVLTANADYFYSDYIKVSAGRYIVSGVSDQHLHMCRYDLEKKFEIGQASGKEIDVPHDGYIVFSAKIAEADVIMCNAGSTALPWEPYTGGQPSPNPEYPQEIRSVKGKNLAKFNNELNTYKGSFTYSKESPEEIICTKLESSAGRFFAVYEVQLKKGEKYCLSAEVSSEHIPTYSYTDKLIGTTFMSSITTYPYTFTSPYTGKVIFGVYANANVIAGAEVWVKNFMVRKASIADDTYVPYGCLRVKAHGKNLWNSDSAFEFTATDTYKVITLSGWRFEAGTMKYLCNVHGFTHGRLVLWAYDASGAMVINTPMPFTRALTQEQADSITTVRLVIEGVTAGTKYSGNFEIMATLDTEATEVEPYTENSITLSQPIRLDGIRDVRDRIVEKDGVFGVDRKWLISRVLSSLSWAYSQNTNRFYALDSRYTKAPNGSEAYNGQYLCTHFGNRDRDDLLISYINDVNRGYAYRYYALNGDIDAWKAFLDENEVYTCGLLDTPTFEPLPTADQIALRSLLSYDGVTHVELDAEVQGTITMEYGTSRVGALALESANKAEKSEIKVAELTAAVLMLNQE